jgi:meso-butanediol dehydrogenase / (S,S)-butanediol dehydrogenase / diacetyl reductase
MWRERHVDWTGKVVLVTGGDGGIGLATARHFRAKGANVVIGARNPSKGELAALELGAHFVRTDVRVTEDCKNAVDEALRVYGALNVLVNNAGVIYRNRTVENTSEEEWDVTMDTNVKGAFLMSKHAMPALRVARGAIVNVASYSGLVGFAGAAAYTASKAALINLTRTMALDHGSEGMRVNCVCPGSIATDMIFEAWRHYGDIDQARALWEAKHPLQRIGAPDEVARLIVFLAGDESSFITGVAIPIDGGISAG